jgi:hypothetical protein
MSLLVTHPTTPAVAPTLGGTNWLHLIFTSWFCGHDQIRRDGSENVNLPLFAPEAPIAGKH